MTVEEAPETAMPADGRAGQPISRLLLESPALVPGVVIVAVFALWAGYQGGFPPTAWYPGALLVLGALVTTVLAVRSPFAGIPWQAVAAVACLGAYTAWSYLSILWADVPGDAWEGANRTLLYLVLYALFALWAWRAGTAAALFGIFALSVTAVLAVYLLRAATATDPTQFFIGGRLAEPAGYANANCALALGAFWPALFLASRRETPWPVRGLMLGAAGFLIEFAVLTESRGSLFAVPIAAILYLAVVPGRVRTVLVMAPLALAAVLTRGPLLDVYTSRGDGDALAAAVDDAAVAAAACAAGLAGLGLLLGLADRFLRISEHASRQIGRILGAAALVVALATTVALVSSYGSPIGWVRDGWNQFSTLHPATEVQFTSSRFSEGLGSNRYDFWRVAMREFRDSPAQGIGADNFATRYVRERRSTEEPRFPHSLEVRLLSQTGIVGAALFTGFVALALAGAARSRRGPSRFAPALSAAMAVTFGYWAIHGSIDWFWEFPALAGPAFAWLGLAAGVGRDPPAAVPAAWPRALRVGSAAALAALVLAAALSIVLPWLAARDVDRALATWRADAPRAFERLDRAHRLDPLSDRADVVAGTIASRLGDWERMGASFRRALERNPHNWYAELELAIAASQQRDLAAARASLARARALNPGETAIELALEHVRSGNPIPPRVIDRLFLDRVQRITS